ncbi:X2-like carbohydrate binding domain-containing protein [Stigmatella sp. ncwal1]|uniref:X2-like carbohydrate binding domain-containing protein n=1 Tax=Stigmatella ashevillensis TaxID=2995309 RepID=A0ABT5DLH3_9BACT|nr:X2-like carbohydrate binding domain-containing protein [Stigmatella ashevillena]MDC0714520.1 X2-like carbohydrate binding domain-containing protein [Stigmatella ashevillena]
MTKKPIGRNSLSLMCLKICIPLWLAASQASAAEGVPYTWKNVVTGGGGGFVPGIVFNETEPDLIYARTDIGGVYRWNPADNSWIPLLDHVGWTDWGKLGVDALATDPVDPRRVYMATGMYTNGWDPNLGYIMRSTDKGNTWQMTQLPFYVGGNMPGRSLGERLAVDPSKNSILYFGARSGNGLWRSTDSGVTWSKVTSFPNPGTYVQDPSNSYQSDIMGIAWVTFDKSTGTPGSATQTIYVGVADTAESIYRSTDGGATWQAIPGQPSGFLPHHGEISNGQLYITYNNGIGPYDGTKGDVYKYNTSTGVWTNISPIPSTSSDNYFGYGGLAIDRKNPNTLMVATLNSWWPDANIYRSTDGGATWTSIWSWVGYPSRNFLYTQDISAAPWLDLGGNPQPPEIALKLGWMMGDLEIDPHNPNRMMYGTGATIYGTNNLLDWGTAKKVNITVMAKDLEEMAVFDLVSPPSGTAQLLSAVGDVSGFRHEDVTKAPAKILTNPNSTSSIDFAQSNPGFVARVGYADKAANPNSKSVALSYDGGSNWFNPSGEPAGTKGGGQIAVAANGSSLVWSTSDIGVFYSAEGNSWTASAGVPAGAKIASDRVNKNTFYALANGRFYVSTNGGALFTPTAATGLPGSGNLKAVPGVEGDLWLAGGSSTTVYGLWHSTNGGASFTALSNVEEADVIGFGKAAPGQTYVALYASAKIDGVRGFFRSDNAGGTWGRINDDSHQYGVTNSAITGDPRVYGRVYIGTNGRGIVYGDLKGDTTNNSSITPTTATFDKKTANQADITVTMTLNGNSLSAIKNGSVSLVSGADYTVSGTTVILKKSYLATQSVGTTHLTFDFSAGSDPVLSVSVVDTTSTPGGVLKVQMYNGQTAASSNSINPRFKIVNTGTSALNLANVTVRYYYTADANKAQSFWYDWASVGTANVKGSFVTMAAPKTGADTYLEIGFTSGAGSLSPGASAELQIRFSRTDWSNYTQTNDYSFDPTGTSYTDWNKATGYISGSLTWGIEP